MSRFTCILSLTLTFLFSLGFAVPLNNGSTFHAEEAQTSDSVAAVSGYRNAGYYVNWYGIYTQDRHAH